MPTTVGSIIRAATRQPDEPLNVLTYSVHERWQSGLAGANAHFYLIQGHGLKSWNSVYAPLPANHTLINNFRDERDLPPDVDFDVVFSHNKEAHFDLSAHLAGKYQLPLVSLEHCLPAPGLGRDYLAAMKSRRGAANVFISAYNRQAWGWQEDEALVIHHGVDTALFRPDPAVARQPVVLSAVNKFRERDWCCGYRLWEEVTAGLPRLHVGDDPPFSLPAGPEELVRHYNSAAVFVNTSLVSPIPTVVLEAMACGAVVVSTDNCMLGDVIRDGDNGFLTNDKKKMRRLLEDVLAEPGGFDDVRASARRTIQSRFSQERFVREWEVLFRRLAGAVLLP